MSKIIISRFILFGIISLFLSTPTHSQQAAASTPDAKNHKSRNSARSNANKAASSEGVDPCNGTGGTGQIISVGSKTITIKRRDGTNETISITDKTGIKNSTGTISKSDLKAGDRVTVIVMSNHTATAVLVCNAASSKPVK